MGLLGPISGFSVNQSIVITVLLSKAPPLNCSSIGPARDNKRSSSRISLFAPSNTQPMSSWIIVRESDS
jgi:hypothetical protein